MAHYYHFFKISENYLVSKPDVMDKTDSGSDLGSITPVPLSILRIRQISTSLPKK